ncbi:MAG: hypothetical protein CMI01_00755 [Oceanospirillaceae bacterium]|nr:hypothetical protein [Oceanospirillaceae bacterium]
MMKEDEITEYLQQFSMEQLEQIKLLVETTAKKKKAQREKPMRSTVGLPPTPPKDVAALAEAADLDISSLMRDIDRRKR